MGEQLEHRIVDLGENAVGLGPGQRWAVVKSGLFFSEDDPRGLMPFMFLLELDLQEFHARVVAGLGSVGLGRQMAETFPYSEVVAQGIASESHIWISHAMGWLPDVRMTPKLEEALRGMIARKDGTQSERHMARRRLKEEGLGGRPNSS